MKTFLLTALISVVTLPAFAQVPPTRRVMVCHKFLFVTIKCEYVNKPVTKPATKKPRVRVDVQKPGNYNNMSPEERAIINQK